MPDRVIVCAGCVLPEWGERPHFTGGPEQVDALVDTATGIGARVMDARGAERARVARALHVLLAEARSRWACRADLTVDDVHVFVVDGRVYDDPQLLALVKHVAAHIRRLALHLLVESRTAAPRTVAVELARPYCSECISGRIVKALGSGEVL